MARLNVSLLLCLIIAACAPAKLTNEINSAQAVHFYKNALQQPDKFFFSYNSDSSYVICTVNDSSQLVSQPITFLVVNIVDKKKSLVSINEYHKAQWIDSLDILLIRYSGIANFNRSLQGEVRDNRSEYIFNVLTNEIKSQPKPDQELF